MIKRLFTLVLIIIMVVCLTVPAFASEAEGEAEAHHPPPSLYYIQWLALAAAFALGLFYAIKLYFKGKPHHEKLILAYLLTLLAAGYFGISYVEAVKEYHEPALLNLLRFVLLMLTGVLITFYGVLGRHDEH